MCFGVVFFLYVMTGVVELLSLLTKVLHHFGGNLSKLEECITWMIIVDHGKGIEGGDLVQISSSESLLRAHTH